MARLLLSAYACEPEKGSEPAVGWNWAVEAARQGHQVCVLTRANNRTAIEQAAAECGGNISFLYYDLPRWIRACKRGSLGIAMYYLLWQWFAYRHIRKEFPAIPFDVVHHVTFASIRYPSFMGRLGIPFYLGPMGGGEMVPAQLRVLLSRTERLREWTRGLSNRLMRINPLIQAMLGRASRIFVTPDTFRLVPRAFRNKCSIRLAIGLTAEYLRSAMPVRRAEGPARLLYVGRLLDYKAVDILLHAMKRLQPEFSSLRLCVVGEGPARDSLTRLCNSLGLAEAVEWRGWLERAEVEDCYRRADILLFPSLRDSGGMAVLEAMAHGLPVICTDLGGPPCVVNRDCGRVVRTAGRSASQIAGGFADALREVISDPVLFTQLSRSARRRACEFDFAHLVASIYGTSIRRASIYGTSINEMKMSAICQERRAV